MTVKRLRSESTGILCIDKERSGKKANMLMEKIMCFQVDTEGDALPFSARLCRENQWNTAYADRCITEYKRFLYLVAVSEREITPSDQVDQVWHLHLLYTKSYWIDLCQKTMGCQVHHKPTKGGAQELARFRRQYQNTLDLYVDVFGSKPPADIWPDVNHRFQNADAFVRTNSAHYWLVRKPSEWLVAALVGSLFMVACTQTDTDSGFWFFIKLAIGVFVLYKIIRWLGGSSGRGNGGGSGGAGCGGCSGCGGCGG
jgi:hypothetical protein